MEREGEETAREREGARERKRESEKERRTERERGKTRESERERKIMKLKSSSFVGGLRGGQTRCSTATAWGRIDEA